MYWLVYFTLYPNTGLIKNKMLQKNPNELYDQPTILEVLSYFSNPWFSYVMPKYFKISFYLFIYTLEFIFYKNWLFLLRDYNDITPNNVKLQDNILEYSPRVQEKVYYTWNIYKFITWIDVK